MKKILNKVFFVVPAVCVFAFVCIMLINGLDTAKSNDSAESYNGESVRTSVVSGLLVELSGEDLYERSTLVIRGKVVGQSDVFQIKPVTGGDASNFIDYYVEIYEVLRGDSSQENDVVSVRIEGGMINGLNVIVEEAPNINADDEVLLYLYRPGRGSWYNTKGDYYYVVGERQGAFVLDETAETKDRVESDQLDEVFVSKNHEGIIYAEATYTEIARQVKDYTDKNPVNENIDYEITLENMKSNLESGFITKEEYDRFLLEDEIYATIVDDN